MTENEDSQEENNKRYKSIDIVFPFLLISCGIVLLLNNFKVLPWEIWNILFIFWPFILILIGIEHLFAGSFLGNIFTFLISATIILAIFIYASININRNFDKWITRKYPSWKQIEDLIPNEAQKDRIFHCNPLTEDCQLYLR